MPFICSSNARELAKLSIEARKRNKEAAKTIAPVSLPSLPELDPFATDLSCACTEVLKELRECKEAKDKSALARTIRDLRETYHLATGQAKPGVIKHNAPRRQMVQPVPPSILAVEPEPIDSQSNQGNVSS